MSLHLETRAGGAVTLSPARPCRRCGAPIAWAITKNAKRMPIDAEATDLGHVVLTTIDGEILPAAQVLNDRRRDLARDLGIPLFRAHFASCTKLHRKRGES